MAVERQYCEFDLRYLVPFLRGTAALEDQRFQALYFGARDVWDRMHPNGAMPSARLQLLVEKYDEIVARDAAKAAKKEKVPA